VIIVVVAVVMVIVLVVLVVVGGICKCCRTPKLCVCVIFYFVSVL